MTIPQSIEPRTTQEWRALDSAHHVHPFTDPMVLAAKGARIITRGEGVYVWDTEGNRILDGMAGLWCVNVGYGRRELIDAAVKQLEALPYYNTFFQSAVPAQIELASQLAELTPWRLTHFFYASSGSEATDTAVRLARHYWRVAGKPTKRTLIGRTLGYHGSTLAAASLGGMANMRSMDGELLPGFGQIEHPHWYAQGGDLTLEEFGLEAARRLERKILELGAENVAAFVGEPVQGAGGVFDPPPGYWGEIQRICRKYDILLIADEVICGFGRTGSWFGSHTYDIEPDLMTMAKGLSSGYQSIAAVAISEDVYDVIRAGGPLAHGYTYSGHPVACAVALANIRLMQREYLVQRVREETAPYFRRCLRELVTSHPLVAELRGEGLLAGLQLMKDKRGRVPFSEQEEAGIKCRDFCLQKNLLIRAVGQTMVFSPPLTISRSEIDELIERTRSGLDSTACHFGVG